MLKLLSYLVRFAIMVLNVKLRYQSQLIVFVEGMAAFYKPNVSCYDVPYVLFCSGFLRKGLTI